MTPLPLSVDIRDMLDEAHARVAFLSAFVMAQGERPKGCCPLDKEGWLGFFYMTQDLKEHLALLCAAAVPPPEPAR